MRLGSSLLLLAIVVWRSAAFAATTPEQATALALEANTASEEQCARAPSLPATEAAQAMEQVWDVAARLSAVVDEGGPAFLLFWRGVLLACAGQERRAYLDLLEFSRSAEAIADFPGLVEDARRRMRLMRSQNVGISATPDRVVSRRGGPPPLELAFGAAYGMSVGQGRFDYFVGDVDLSVRVVGPLRVLAYARPGISGLALPVDGSAPVERWRSVLVPFGAGLQLRFEGPVRPALGLVAHLALERRPSADDPRPADEAVADAPLRVLPGVALHAGVDLPLEGAPVALRPHVELGNLGKNFVVRAGADLVVSIGN